MTVTRFLAAVVVAAAAVTRAAAQTAPTPVVTDSACGEKRFHVVDDFLPAFTLRHLDGAEVEAVRDHVDHGDWPAVIRAVLNNYQGGLPTWVVYIDRNTRVKQCVLSDERTIRLVRGKRFMWAMVISERPLGPNTGLHDSTVRAFNDTTVMAQRELVNVLNNLRRAGMAAEPQVEWARAVARLDSSLITRVEGGGGNGSDTLDLKMSRRVVVKQTDPVIIGLIKGLAGGFGFNLPDTPTLPDSSRSVDLAQVSTEKTNPLYVGLARMGMVENAVVEFSLTPWPGKTFPEHGADVRQLDRIYTNVADLHERTFELGFDAGVAYGRVVRQYDTNLHETGKTSPADFNVYATLFMNMPWHHGWFPVKWKEGWQRASFGPFIGTNIKGTLGEQVIAGASLGHFIGDAGISLGAAWIPTTTLSGGALVTPRKPRLFSGVDLRL